VLLVHALLLPRDQRTAGLRKLPWLLLSPAVLFVFWPLLWHDPLRHLRDWIAFHTHHVHYAWWYFGQVLRAPPFPVEYPLVLDAMVLPLPTVALLAAAGISLLAGFARAGSNPSACSSSASRAPRCCPSAPHHADLRRHQALAGVRGPADARGGFPAGAGRAAAAAARSGGSRHARRGRLADRPRPPLRHQRLRGAVGWHPGAATLGMQRQYWSNNVTGVLPWLNANCPPGARVYFHEVNVESYRTYVLVGMLRGDIRYAPDPNRPITRAAVAPGVPRPRAGDLERVRDAAAATGLYLDEVPQVVVYARPGLPGGP